MTNVIWLWLKQLLTAGKTVSSLDVQIPFPGIELRLQNIDHNIGVEQGKCMFFPKKQENNAGFFSPVCNFRKWLLSRILMSDIRQTKIIRRMLPEIHFDYRGMALGQACSGAFINRYIINILCFEILSYNREVPGETQEISASARTAKLNGKTIILQPMLPDRPYVCRNHLIEIPDLELGKLT